MEINGVKIRVPEGMEYYVENGEIKFRKKLSLDDVYKKLFFNRPIYYMGNTGWSSERKDNFDSIIPLDNREFRNNCTSEKQVEKLLAIIQLMNVAKYLNGDWQPDWYDIKSCKYYIYLMPNNDICISSGVHNNKYIVVFKTENIAQQAIDILGEETIKLALSTDW